MAGNNPNRVDIRVAGDSNYTFTGTTPGDLIFSLPSNRAVFFGAAGDAPYLKVNKDTVEATGEFRASNIYVTGTFYQNGVPFQGTGGGSGGPGIFTQGTGCNYYVIGSNVAIGSSNPDANFYVSGRTKLEGEVVLPASLSFSGVTLESGGSNGTVTYSSPWTDDATTVTTTKNVSVAGDLNFNGTLKQNGVPYVGSQFSNTSSNVFILNSNVGIGLSNPTAPLEVAGTIKASNLNFTGQLLQNGVPYIGSQWSNSSSNIFVLSSNVGIGLSNPSTALEVATTVKVGPNIINTSNVSLGASTVALPNRVNFGGFSINKRTDPAVSTNLTIQPQFQSSASNIYLLANSNLGIGKSNPAFPLDIVGDLNFTGQLRQGGVPYVGSQWSNTSNNVFILNSNIGIGLSNPSAPLEVAGTIKTSNINFTGQLLQNGTPYIGSQFSNTSSNVFIIGSNVAIGKSNASSALDVAGTVTACNINFTGQLLQNGTPYIGSQFSNTSNIVFITGSNIGIGTSNPATPLEVVGDVTVSGTLLPKTNATQSIGTAASRLSNIWIDNISTSQTLVVGASNTTIAGNVTINGNATIMGSNFIANVQTVEVKDNTLLLNKGETGAGVTAGTAGLSIDRGTTSNPYQILFEESSQTLRIGLNNALQTAATREWVTPTSNTAYWSSNTATVASNTAYWSSNTATVASNTAYWSSNTATVASNTAYWSSNNLVNKAGDFMSGPIKQNANDTSNAPSYTWSNDTNTGMYHASNGIIGFASLGSNVLTLTATGGISASNAAGLSNLNAANISVGTLPVVRGGTGTTTSTGTGSVVLNTAPTFSGTVTTVAQGTDGVTITGCNAYAALTMSNTLTSVNIGLCYNNNEFSTSARSRDFVVRNTSTTSRILLQTGPTAASFCINSNNYVGIGTTTPTTTLEVGGGITASNVYLNTSDTSNTPAYSFTGDTTTGMFHQAQSTLGFTAAGSNTLTVTPSNIAVAGDVALTRGVNVNRLAINRRSAVGSLTNITSTVASIPALSSTTSNLTFSLSNGQTQFRYADSNNSNVVTVDTSVATTPAMTLGSMTAPGYISAGNLGLFRNRIINGDMRIAQRGLTGTVSSSNGSLYVTDRFKIVYSFTTTGGITQSNLQLTSNDTPYQYGFNKALRVAASTANTNYDYIDLQQPIEGINIDDLRWGTAFGSPVSVSFMIRTNVPAGSTLCCALRNSAFNQSYVATFTVTASNAWQYVTLSNIPAPPVGSTWATDSNAGVYLSIGAHTTGNSAYYSATPNSWVANNRFTTSGAVNTWATLNNFIDITGVQLEKGTMCTPFEYRPYAVELQLCQRYYYISPRVTLVRHSTAGSFSGVQPLQIKFATDMRFPVSISNVTLSNITTVGTMSIVNSASLTSESTFSSTTGINIWTLTNPAVGDFSTFNLLVSTEL